METFKIKIENTNQQINVRFSNVLDKEQDVNIESDLHIHGLFVRI